MPEWAPKEDHTMKTKLLVLLAVVIALLAVSGPMFAHHGTAAFETKDMVTVKATMTDFQFINPHVQLHFEVKNEKGLSLIHI